MVYLHIADDITMRHALLASGLALLLAGCASVGSKGDQLTQIQYDYSAAIRWGDFEGAWSLVDPEYKKAHPMSDVDFSRYQQVQVSGYTDLATQVSPDQSTAMREIQINVINKHTMAERSMRYTEQWRYDPEAGQWWVSGGLPDLWAGE